MSVDLRCDNFEVVATLGIASDEVGEDAGILDVTFFSGLIDGISGIRNDYPGVWLGESAIFIENRIV